MTTVKWILGLVVLGACAQEPMSEEGKEIYEADAVFSNTIAADGCSWHFEIQGVDSTITLLAPSLTSFKTIEAKLGSMESSYSTTQVRLQYSFTGNKRAVPCGWGTTSEMDEITVRSIRKK
ncbi:hypothetical protein [Dyadobacter tibetensis]|uniref:hypothetical protein n=1 Tax=Dyadobacter tibetensis TaxID=1211851 RepID=UPI000471190B|nr:hypothetical protein [Dyadobacter tibetensis]